MFGGIVRLIDAQLVKSYSFDKMFRLAVLELSYCTDARISELMQND